MNNVTTLTQPASRPMDEIEVDTAVILHFVDEYERARARERAMAKRIQNGEKLHGPLYDLQQRSAELRSRIQRELRVSFCRAAGIEIADESADAEAKGA